MVLIFIKKTEGKGKLKKLEKIRKKIIDSCRMDPEITYLISRGWSVDK